MQSFKTMAFFLLPDSGGYVKFTSIYTIAGVEGRGTRIIFECSKLDLLVT
jgi:hypothetical protein